MTKPPRRPSPPFPQQHQRRPGAEGEMSPPPQFEAPAYVGAGRLRGRVALITGGDSGIGRATAVLCAREGADVAIVSLPSEKADAAVTAKAVRDEGQECLALTGDVRERRTCDRLVKKTVETFGRLDVLVNNAAYQHHRTSIQDISDAQWLRTFQTNIHGYFFMAHAALRHMERGAAIVNVGSITGLEGHGAAGGDCPGHRVPGVECRFELHHRRSDRPAGRGDDRVDPQNPPPERPPAGGVAGSVAGGVVGVGTGVGVAAGASGIESGGVTGAAGAASGAGPLTPLTTELPKPPLEPITARIRDPNMNSAPRIVVARVSTVAPARAPKAA